MSALASAATATAIAFCKAGVDFRFSSVTDRFVSAFSDRRFQISEGDDECWTRVGSRGSESLDFSFVLAVVTVFDKTSGGGWRKDVERGGRIASVLLIGAGGADGLGPCVVPLTLEMTLLVSFFFCTVGWGGR